MAPVLFLHNILEPEKTLELFIFQMKEQTTGKMRQLAQGHSASNDKTDVILYFTPCFTLSSKLMSENEEFTNCFG